MADFRSIPSIDQMRQRAAIRALEARFGAEATTDALRAAAAAVREAIARGDASFADDGGVVERLETVAQASLDEQFRPSLEPVINATGVVLHTNLGRAPLAAAALDRIASGAQLREVGTTNKTRAADYAAAIGDRTALILRVHPSNFRIDGFTERPALTELVAVGRRFNIPVAEDLGSGYLGSGYPGSDRGQHGVGLGSDRGQMAVRPLHEILRMTEPAVPDSV